nr:hypothetical protein [Brachyspira hyodysenteriae]
MSFPISSPSPSTFIFTASLIYGSLFPKASTAFTVILIESQDEPSLIELIS